VPFAIRLRKMHNKWNYGDSLLNSSPLPCSLPMARLLRIVVAHAEEWRWSSAGARLPGRNDGLVTVAPVLDRYGDFGTFLAQEPEDDAFRRLRISETTGRPLGSDEWLDMLE